MSGNSPNDVLEPQVSTVTPVSEGDATILFPSANEVFYNPVQQFNRDLSILAIRAWSKTHIEERTAKIKFQRARQSKKRKLNHDDETEACRSRPSNSTGIQPADTSGPSLLSQVIDDNQTTEVAIDRNTSEQDSKLPSNCIENDEQPLDIKFTILEALSATGLRAIRYAKEIPNLASVTANDLSATAVEQIKANSEYNKTTHLVQPNQGDARVVMYTTKKKFNVIDLDPYGSAAPFLDAAVQAVEDGGLLLVTCTDLAVLAGDAHPEKCWSQYGGTPLKTSDFCHEQALRMVLNTIASCAARYGRAITPLLSLSIDFYVRLFVRVDTSPAKVKLLMSNTMLTYQCSGCKTHTNQPMGTRKQGSRPDLFKYQNSLLSGNKLCEHCGFPQHVGGPMYAGALHDDGFIDQILQYASEAEKSESNVFGTIPRIRGMLTVAKEELLEPHHWSLAKLTKVLHCQSPALDKILSAIVNAGYEVSGSHTGPRCLKTTAPASFMWDMMRAWILENPIREESIKPGTAGAVILARREPDVAVDFTYNKSIKGASREKGIVRYQINPTENWGPKAMARGTTSDTTNQFRATDKRKRSEEDLQKNE